MSDRELLEWAAKAAGIEFYTPEGMDEPWFALTNQSGFYLRGCKVWNPLVDDGDALRLAVKCRVDFTIVEISGIEQVEAHGPFDGFFTEDMGDDKMASVRRCIVRAAASIGQQKEGG